MFAHVKPGTVETRDNAMQMTQMTEQFQRGDEIWFRGRPATFARYCGSSAALIRVRGTGPITAVQRSKLGRTRRESLELSLLTTT